MITSAQVTVTTSPTSLAGGDADGGSVVVLNTSAVDVFLGAAAVSTATGLKLAAGQSLSVDLAPSEALFAIVAAGTAVVHALRSGF
jgi:hypothetical protein